MQEISQAGYFFCSLSASAVKTKSLSCDCFHFRFHTIAGKQIFCRESWTWKGTQAGVYSCGKDLLPCRWGGGGGEGILKGKWRGVHTTKLKTHSGKVRSTRQAILNWNFGRKHTLAIPAITFIVSIRKGYLV